MSSKKVTVGGKSVDLDKLDEVTALQATLVPDNWPIAKREGVKLFLTLQEMAALEFKRHLAFNFKSVLKTAMEQKAAGEEPTVAVSFSVDFNFTAPSVAGFGKTKMSFSQKFSTEGKPKTHDINQGEFLDNDLNVVLDTKSLAKEMAPAPKVEKPKKEAKVKVTKVAKFPETKK